MKKTSHTDSAADIVLSKVSPGALSQELGTSRQTVWRKLKRGSTPDQIRKEAKAWQEAAANRANPGGSQSHGQVRNVPKAGEVPSYTVSQARKEAALAGLREVELRMKTGELVKIADVRSRFSVMIVRARGELLQLPNLLRERLGAMDGPACEQLLDREIQRVFNALRDRLKQEATANE